MDFSPYIYHLGCYASQDQWRHVTADLCRQVISKIMDDAATQESWFALQELLGAWPDADDIAQWVAELESRIDHWPWKMRHSVLGQPHTRADKQCVYRLVGYLHIENIEDGGPKLRNWCQNPNWQNLKGIGLYKVDAETEDLAAFLQSPYLSQLETLELRSLDSLSGELGIVFQHTRLLQLTELNLLSLNLRSEDLAVLDRIGLGRQLAKLNLSGNFIHDHDLALLMNPAKFSRLQVLDLSYTSITAVELEKVLANLNHTSLERLVIEGTEAARSMGRDILDDLAEFRS